MQQPGKASLPFYSIPVAVKDNIDVKCLPMTAACLARRARHRCRCVCGFYQLEDLGRLRDHTFRNIDAMVLPTASTIYSIAQVRADPIAHNSRLGRYTSFANLLDMCTLAVPAAMRLDGAPFGVTLVAPGTTTSRLPRWRVFHAATELPLGALGSAATGRAGSARARRWGDSARRCRGSSLRHAAQR